MPSAKANTGMQTARPAYLVLGMHRSGTSAATQLLALAGANLPGRLISPHWGRNVNTFSHCSRFSTKDTVAARHSSGEAAAVTPAVTHTKTASHLAHMGL